MKTKPNYKHESVFWENTHLLEKDGRKLKIKNLDKVVARLRAGYLKAWEIDEPSRAKFLREVLQERLEEETARRKYGL